MKKRAGVFVVLSVILALSAQTLFAQSPYPETKDYATETQAVQFRPHSGDRQEIGDYFDFLIANYLNPDEINTIIAGNSSARSAVDTYFRKLAGFSSIKLVSATIDKLYSVQEADIYNNMRAIAKFKFIAEDTNGKLFRHTDYLGLAKLGKEETDWRVWGVLWQDSGFDVSPANLIQFEMPEPGEEICVMTTDAGVIKMRLFPDHAPKSVHNFKVLAKLGFYNNVPFYRVYDEFMIQAGVVEDDGEDNEGTVYGRLFEDEFSRDLRNFRGALCMANSGPNTNSNHFYIVQSPVAPEEYLELSSLPVNVEEKYREVGGRAYLDMRYTVFGHAFEGLEVVDVIARQPANEMGRPTGQAIKILSVKFETY